MQATNETTLFSSVKGILSSELKTYEKMIMIVLKMYQHEYGDVFPDYETIAACGGMSKRKAQYVVKELSDKQIISKAHRFKAKPNGTRKQTSNQYLNIWEARSEEIVIEPQEKINAQDALIVNELYAKDAPYNSGFINQESFNLYPSTVLKNKEEDDITRMREIELIKYARYAPIYREMVSQQGTGVLSYLQMEFLDNCITYNFPPVLVKSIYSRIKAFINEYHFDSIHRTFQKYAERLSRKSIDNPIAWFQSTYRNEDIKVRCELALRMANKSVS